MAAAKLVKTGHKETTFKYQKLCAALTKVPCNRWAKFKVHQIKMLFGQACQGHIQIVNIKKKDIYFLALRGTYIWYI